MHPLCAGQRVTKILETAAAAAEEHRRRISTATINMVVRDTVNWRQPPTLRGSNRKGRIYYATQVSSNPRDYLGPAGLCVRVVMRKETLLHSFELAKRQACIVAWGYKPSGHTLLKRALYVSGLSRPADCAQCSLDLQHEGSELTARGGVVDMSSMTYFLIGVWHPPSK